MHSYRLHLLSCGLTILTPYSTCSGDQGQPGLPGFRGPTGPDGTPDRPGPSGDHGYVGSKGYTGEKIQFNQRHKKDQRRRPYQAASLHWNTVYTVTVKSSLYSLLPTLWTLNCEQ